MYVCFCNAVTDRAVRKAVARGAASVDDIAAACGAGSGCGGCRELLELLLGRAPGAWSGDGADLQPATGSAPLDPGMASFRS